jgi:hypothetical protein
MDPESGSSIFQQVLDLPDPKMQNVTFKKISILFDFCVNSYYFELLNSIVFFFGEQKIQKV